MCCAVMNGNYALSLFRRRKLVDSSVITEGCVCETGKRLSLFTAGLRKQIGRTLRKGLRDYKLYVCEYWVSIFKSKCRKLVYRNPSCPKTQMKILHGEVHTRVDDPSYNHLRSSNRSEICPNLQKDLFVYGHLQGYNLSATKQNRRKPRVYE